MSKDTNIEWCDSSVNLEMGCDGCELWNPKADIKHCYAGTLTERYAGVNKGFPTSFDKPKLFLERLDAALRWSDLTGKERPDKPFLNGLPRMIFLNDMGDSFTESLPIDWLAPLLPRIAESPHIWMLLTKRAGRMKAFAESCPLPDNIWPGVSVTSQGNVGRVSELLEIRSGGKKWISAEPLLDAVDFSKAFFVGEEGGWEYVGSKRQMIDLAICGGESGPNARPFNVQWARDLRDQCKAAGVNYFLKQLGANVEWNGFQGWYADGPSDVWPKGLRSEATDSGNFRVFLKDPKGGNPEEWPKDLRVREMPNAAHQIA